MERLRNNILLSWENPSVRQQYTDPLDLVLDVVGCVTMNRNTCGYYLRQLALADFKDAIEEGFDDFHGFTFYYMVNRFVKESDLISRMRDISGTKDMSA